MGNFMYDLAFKCRAMRDTLNCTCDELAKRYNISAAQISHYESSKETPSLLYLYKMTKAVGVTLNDLVELDKKEFMKKLYFN